MNTKTTPKDFFLHLGATVSLYIAAIALMNLAFQVINRSLPDALSYYYGAGQIVWPISIIIILTPVLYVLEWLINRDTFKDPSKKDVWIFRWRIFLTLFLTGAAIIGDLIFLLSTYLNGEITSRFVYKVIAVLVVSAVIFAFYLLKRLDGSPKMITWRKVLAWAGIILALAGVVGGFVIVGSPAKQRSLRFDQQRVSDLTSIQYRIFDYWQKTAKLPETLQVLADDKIFGVSVPMDPETKQPYEYSKKAENSFELCATFDLPSEDERYGRSYSSQNDNWTHGGGRVCFERGIDPNLYSPRGSVIKDPSPVIPKI